MKNMKLLTKEELLELKKLSLKLKQDVKTIIKNICLKITFDCIGYKTKYNSDLERYNRRQGIEVLRE